MSIETLPRSIEVEYWVIDDSGHLTTPGSLVDAADTVEREFVKPLLEIKTPPCDTMGELRDALLTRLEAVLTQAEREGKHLVPLGTPLTDTEIKALDSERTKIQKQAVGNVFDYVCHCAGTHIHVEQIPGHEADQINLLTALDPALALLNSSPGYRHDLGVPGTRSKLYRWLAYDEIKQQGRLWPYISSTTEWDQRLEEGYEHFRSAALQAGVERGVVSEHFNPDTAVWVPVKLRSEFPTVEWRSPDTALPSDVLQIASTISDLMERLPLVDVEIGGDSGGVSDGTISLPTFDVVQEYTRDAIQQGLESDPLQAYLYQMGFEPRRYDPIAHDISIQQGISSTQAEQIRKKYAKKLKKDVQRIQSRNIA